MLKKTFFKEQIRSQLIAKKKSFDLNWHQKWRKKIRFPKNSLEENFVRKKKNENAHNSFFNKFEAKTSFINDGNDVKYRQLEPLNKFYSKLLIINDVTQILIFFHTPFKHDDIYGRPRTLTNYIGIMFYCLKTSHPIINPGSNIIMTKSPFQDC